MSILEEGSAIKKRNGKLEKILTEGSKIYGHSVMLETEQGDKTLVDVISAIGGIVDVDLNFTDNDLEVGAEVDENGTLSITLPNPTVEAYNVEIFSTRGNRFYYGLESSIIYVKVYSNTNDVTQELIDQGATFGWARHSNDIDGDAGWTPTYHHFPDQIIVDKDDIRLEANFTCDIYIP